MSGSSAVEIDFFNVKTESPTPPPPKKPFDRRDIQGVISKINPELLKTAMASASASASASFNKTSSMANKSFSVPASPTLPVFNQTTASSDRSNLVGTAPLTIFYNGAVCIFDVSHHQAENIIKLVEGGKAVDSTTSVKPVTSPTPFARVVNQDLPLSRKKSLRRFLEKRKERQNLVSPYASPADNSISR